MGVDGIFLHFLKNEVADYAVGAKIEKIYLPTKYELVLSLRTRAESRRFSVRVRRESTSSYLVGR